jgi:hypothetical protein
MTNPKNVDLTEDRIFPLGWGLVFRCVCAPKSWSAERVENDVTANDPPGTTANRWVVSDPSERDDDFNGVNRLPCPDDQNRQHWLLNC